MKRKANREKQNSAAVVVANQDAQIVATVERLADAAKGFMLDAAAGNTKRAYSSDWRHFGAFCQRLNLSPLPAAAETVALYLTELAERGLKTSTIGRHVAAINAAHKAAGLESPAALPVVASTWRGIRRRLGARQAGKAPVLVADVLKMVNATPADSLRGLRDRAILLVGFAGAFRRSELCNLDASDVQFTERGALVTLRKSKTDQEGAGRLVAIPNGCPVAALRVWLDASGIVEGRLFRGIDHNTGAMLATLDGRSVNLIVKRAARAAGLEAANLGAHSLRSGFVTSAAEAGASDFDIMATTGHATRAMVDRYRRPVDAFKNNAAARLGL